MKLSSRKVGDVTVLDIEGQILFGEGDGKIRQAVESLIQAGQKKVLLNLAEVPYVDSAGLGEMIRCFTAMRRAQGNLKLLGPNQRLIDLLSMTKLDKVFDWYNDEASALAGFA